MSRKRKNKPHPEVEAQDASGRYESRSELPIDDGSDAFHGEPTESGVQRAWEDAADTYDGDIDQLESTTNGFLAEDENAATNGSALPLRKTRGQARQFAAHPALAYTGVGVMITGFSLSVLAMIPPEYGGRASKILETSGLTPGLIVTLGIILSLMAVIRRQQQALQARVAWIEETVIENGDYNAQCLGYLVESQEHSPQGPTASGGDTDALLHSMSRQNDKLNNLTKALKMYGGPLVEVSRQTSENGQNLKKVEEAIDGITEKIRRPVAELVTKVSRKENAAITKAIGELAEQIRSDLSELLEVTKTSGSKSGPQSDSALEILETVQQELAQLNRTVADRPMSDASRKQVKDPWGSGGSPVLDALHGDNPEPYAASSDKPSASAVKTNDQGCGPASSISGTSKSSGESVLGAIEKLKKMR